MRPADLEPEVTYFASGSSAVLDLRGFARIGHAIGVSIPELSEAALLELEALAGRGVQVFVDTGAFGEKKFGPSGPVVVAPIDDAGWAMRMAVHRRLALALREQAVLVAPDSVGDQAETLARLAAHAEALRELRATGARILVPIQRGAMSALEFDAAVCATIGFSDFVRGIPGNKAAMPTAELETYVRCARPAAAHFLGIGPKNPRYQALVDVFRRLAPAAALSCDSNLLAANVGRTNGRAGAPRRLTAVQNGTGVFQNASGEPEPVRRDDAIVLAFGPQVFFRRMARALAEQGIVLRGFERVDDGIEVEGFELPREAPLQLGLFDQEA